MFIGANGRVRVHLNVPRRVNVHPVTPLGSNREFTCISGMERNTTAFLSLSLFPFPFLFPLSSFVRADGTGFAVVIVVDVAPWRRDGDAQFVCDARRARRYKVRS